MQLLVAELGATPLIGFAGAPFTVASYLVEGGPSKEHAKTKAMMYGAPDVWDALMRKIASISAAPDLLPFPAHAVFGIFQNDPAAGELDANLICPRKVSAATRLLSLVNQILNLAVKYLAFRFTKNIQHLSKRLRSSSSSSLFSSRSFFRASAVFTTRVRL